MALLLNRLRGLFGEIITDQHNVLSEVRLGKLGQR